MYIHKTYAIEPDGVFGYYRVRSKAQGQSPRDLNGVYTTRTMAEKAIDAYLATKEKPNGKTKAINRG